MLQGGDIDWKTVRVLLFSRDDAFRFLVRQTFRKINVREILSTSEAADAGPMMGQIPDIALLDPEGGVDMALAFLQRVRLADPAMPVLLMGASADRALLARFLPLGLEGVVPKRVSGHELVHRAAGAMKKPQRLPVPAVAATSPLDRPLPVRGAVSEPPPNPSPPAMPGHMTSAVPGQITPPVAPGAFASPIEPSAAGPDGGSAAGFGFGLGPDLRPLRGGRLDEADILSDPARKSRDYDLVEDDPLAKRLAERRKKQWLEEMAREGKKPTKGKDVAALDVSAIVAAHALWLTSQGAEGQRAVFNAMDLGGADLSGAVLANASFREAELSDAFLADSRLDGADFRHAVLGAAHLGGANLGVAQLRHADLRLANLEGAVLRGADLSGARLSGAKLDGADLRGAVLMGCDLTGADLSKVENLTQAQVEKTLCDLETRLPPGLSRPVRDA